MMISDYTHIYTYNKYCVDYNKSRSGCRDTQLQISPPLSGRYLPEGNKPKGVRNDHLEIRLLIN